MGKHTSPASFIYDSLVALSKGSEPVGKAFFAVRSCSVPTLKVLTTLAEKDKVSQYMWAPVHLLFGSMPLKNPKQNLAWEKKKKRKKKLGLKHDHYPQTPVLFHCSERPAKSILISPSFFVKLKPDKFRTKIPWKMHSTDSLLGICCQVLYLLRIGFIKSTIPALTDL